MGKLQLSRFFKQGDFWLVVGVFGAVMLLILPVAPAEGR